MSLHAVVAKMRQTDVFVSMHGGDCINALHMRPGRAVIELVNHGFEKAPWVWLDQYMRLVKRTFRVRRIVLPSTSGQRASGSNQTQNWKQMQKNFADAWNANGTLPWPRLRDELHAIVHERPLTRAAGGQPQQPPPQRQQPPPQRQQPQPPQQQRRRHMTRLEHEGVDEPPPKYGTLVVLVPYFGAPPPWLPIALASMGGPNAELVRFFIVGDASVPPDVSVPSNVRFVPAEWDEVHRRVREKLGVDMPYDSPSYQCKGCVMYSSDRAAANASVLAAEARARVAGSLLHHSNKVTDLKPFMAALWPELLAGAAWWAWGDIDVLWGDLPRYLALAPPRGSFVCPLLPNPWGAATWGPFTAWRIAHNTTELFRESRKWRRVLQEPRPMQFDEWWGSGSSDWRMSFVVQRLVRQGRLGDAGVALPLAEAKSCVDPCAWCPCGAYTFEWRASRGADGVGGLRVNGGSEVMLLHLAIAKRGWDAANTPPHVARATCLHGRIGTQRTRRGAPAAVRPAPLERNRPARGTGRSISYDGRVAVGVCDAADGSRQRKRES